MSSNTSSLWKVLAAASGGVIIGGIVVIIGLRYHAAGSKEQTPEIRKVATEATEASMSQRQPDSNSLGTTAAGIVGNTNKVPLSNGGLTAAIIEEKGSSGVTNTGIARTNSEPSAASTVAKPPYAGVFVLAVGVNDAPTNFSRLTLATNDASDVAKTLGEKYGFTRATVLLDQNATRESIAKELDAIDTKLSLTPGSDFIFFFSGHGYTQAEQKVEDGRTNRIRHGFLVPYAPQLADSSKLEDWNKQAVGMTWLVDRVIRLKARHRLIVLDSCFSGMALATHLVIHHQAEDVFEEAIAFPTIQIITAGLDSESALEKRGMRNSVFTGFLLEEWHRPGVRTVEEIFFPLRAGVRNWAQSNAADSTMTPQHRHLVHTNGAFVFVPPDRYGDWAGIRPAFDGEVVKKGYHKPVEVVELQELTNAPSGGQESDPVWQARVERYEARASVGDANAMAALAQMYRKGLGTKPNPKRADLWAQEGSETFAFSPSYSKMFGIKDSNTALLVDSLLGTQAGRIPWNPPGSPGLPGVIPGAAILSGKDPATTVAVFQTVANLFKTRSAGRGAGNGLEGRISEIETDLKDLKIPTNRTKAKLESLKSELTVLANGIPSEETKAKVRELLDKLTQVSRDLDLGKRQGALLAVSELKKLFSTESQQPAVGSR